MPIEIKELVIKTTVTDHHQEPKVSPTQDLSALKETILAECKAYLNEKLKEERRR